ncbi:EAL domain-containing protein [Paenisporosarcina antarctica]|uniref:EAL domain-containing protein n=1 Tax=Paenisporosarcina antarctica TaxID=417367 RepID=A0A4P7A0I7_9BACL|nr:EAL domain-containing protein [Paenisporosarcina antarctica]
MKYNRLTTLINYLEFLNSKRTSHFQEFKKNEEFKRLMQAEKIKTFFQPIVSLDKEETVGFEILNRPQSTALFPTTEKFYDYVGQSDNVFIVEGFLRNLSLERYAEQLDQTQGHNKRLIFLNIQPQVLADPAYRSGKTLEILSKYNLSPNQIVLELTEKEAVIDYNQFEKIIENYRKQGFRIAVDDAGTGYNSLKTLVYLKPEFIKIDKSLIRNISDQPEQQHLVELLLEFALQSKTEVIAEGIETLSELRYLQNLGIQMGQGYALGKPTPILSSGYFPLTKFPIVSPSNHIYGAK